MGEERIVLAILRFCWPLRPLETGEVPLTLDERRSFRRWQAAVFGPVLLLVPLLGLAWYVSLRGAAEVCYPWPPGAVRLLKPHGIYWALPAAVLGVFSVGAPTCWWARCLLGGRVERFFRACNEDAEGIAWGRAFRALLGLALVGTSIDAVFLVYFYARLDQTGIEIGHPRTLSRQWVPYQSIRRIELEEMPFFPGGNRVDRSRYWIHSDALQSPWRLDGEYSLEEPEINELAQWIATQAGKPIVKRR